MSGIPGAEPQARGARQTSDPRRIISRVAHDAAPGILRSERTPQLVLAIGTDIQTLEQDGAQVVDAAGIDNGVVGVAHALAAAGGPPAAKHQVAGWVRHAGERPLHEVVVGGGVGAGPAAHQTVGVW